MKKPPTATVLVALMIASSPLVAQESSENSTESPTASTAESTSSNTESAPSTTSLSDTEQQEMVSEDPIPDTSTVVEAARAESYSNQSLDHSVSHALFEQGYFSGEDQNSKEAFISALKNFQTLNGMDPTGEITPEVAEKLGVGQDQFSPE